MSQATLSIDALAVLFRPVFRQFGIQKAVLFGSLSRGDASRRSDIDLLLIQKTNKPFFARYDGILHALNRVSPGAAVDALIYTPEELVAMAGNPFIETATSEGKVIYESKSG